MACQTAFHTTELLENILVFLPLADLLHVQAVCKQWERIITKSSVLQEKLFFKPAKKGSVWLADVVNLPSGTGPLPRRYASYVYVKAAVSTSSKVLESHHGLIVTPVRFNTLRLKKHRSDRSSIDGHSRSVDINANHGTPLAFHLKNFDQDRSWQDMLLTQPPVEYIFLEPARGQSVEKFLESLSIDREAQFWSMSSTAKIFVKGGVRFRDVVSKLKMWSEAGMEIMDDYVIHLHGAISVNNEDEELVKARTERPQDKASGSDLVQI